MSFGWNCMFRKGQWLEFRRFVLLQRQNVGSRINYINKEISRIGEIRITYEKVGEGEDQVCTEKRVGLKVDVNSAEYLPILPWDSDTLVRLSLVIPW